MNILKRELQVACSRRAQPLWLRVTKWVLILVIGGWLWPTPYFWAVFGAALALALTVHFFYRWKTKGWTQP